MAELDARVRLPLTDLDAAAGDAAARMRLIAGGGMADRAETMRVAGRLERALEADRQRRAELMLSAPEPGARRDDLAAFHNRLRIMVGIDRHELVAAGVMAQDDLLDWVAFQHDPFRWFIRAGDDRAQRLWGLIQKRGGDRRCG